MKVKKIFCMFLAGTFFILGAHVANAEKMNKIAAIVNGDIVTEEELDLFMRMEGTQSKTDISKTAAQDLRSQLLSRMIEDRLILQEAKRLQIKPDERAVNDRIRDIKEKAGSPAAFEQALRAQGISLAELKEKLRNQYFIFAVVQREVKGKVLISPKEVTDYYQAHSDEFNTVESVSVESIFVEDKKSLNLVEAALKDGKDFLEVAGEYSKKASLGIVPRGQLKKELEDVIFGLEKDERSKPVSVEGGFYIFLVKEKLPPSVKALDEVKDAIAGQLEMVKVERFLKEWIESLKDKAYISIREK